MNGAAIGAIQLPGENDGHWVRVNSNDDDELSIVSDHAAWKEMEDMRAYG